MLPVAGLNGFRFFNAAFGGGTSEEAYYFIEHFATNLELVILGVDLGQTDPPVPSGAAPADGSLPIALTQPTVTIDGQPAEVLFAGLTPGSVGLYQIRLRVPAEARAGDLGVAILQGVAQSNPGVLPVR